jgi:hypothetical protein
MKRGLSLALLLFFASGVRADIPLLGGRPPRRPTPVHPAHAVPLSIEAGANNEPARLLIPRSLLERAAKRRHASAAGVLDLSMPVVLSLTLVGLCALGFRGRGRMVSLLVFAALAALGVSMLNATPPPLLEVNGKALPLNTVRVEISDKGNTLRLILPARRWAELGKRL